MIIQLPQKLNPMRNQKTAWHRLTINQKIKIKQHFIGKYGKQVHWNKPDVFKELSETQIIYLLATKN
jgi:hypothetical protein